jgi:tetratricopeptide (TPR) repeat protein
MLFAWLLLAPVVAAGSAAFEQAVREYKARRYSQAISGFRTVLTASPSDAMSHYYLALCYQGTNQISQAKQEYEWVLRMSQSPQLRNFASSGLAGLSRYRTTFGSAAADPARATPPAGAVHIVGRLKVIEFYADW